MTSWSANARTFSTRDRPFGPLSVAASRHTMWKSALRPQRCQTSICISGFAPRSSRLVLSAGPGRVSGWQPPARFCASSAGTSARSLLRFRASNKATTKHARVDLVSSGPTRSLGHCFAMRMRGQPRWQRCRQAVLTDGFASRYCGFAYAADGPKSIATHGSSPTTQASWPGSIRATSPGPISLSVPSFITTCIRPDNA